MTSKERINYIKKILYSYLIQKRRRIPIDKLVYLDSGSYATVFRYEDRVFKVTSSYEDFRMAEEIMRGNYSSFTQCYSLDAIEFEREEFYIIETKYEGKTIGDLYGENHINRIICDFLCDWFYCGLHRPEISEGEDLEEVYREIVSGRERVRDLLTDEVKQSLVEFYLFYKNLYTEYKNLEGRFFDYHIFNICYRDGTLKVIDFGCGGNKRNSVQKINFIKVNYPKYEFLRNLLRFKRMKFLKN